MVGIGLFLTLIGLIDTGVVVKPAAPSVPLGIGDLTAPETLLAILAFLVMSILIIRKVKGAIMYGILGTTALAFILKSRRNRSAGRHSADRIHVHAAVTFAGSVPVPVFRSIHMGIFPDYSDGVYHGFRRYDGDRHRRQRTGGASG